MKIILKKLFHDALNLISDGMQPYAESSTAALIAVAFIVIVICVVIIL